MFNSKSKPHVALVTTWPLINDTGGTARVFYNMANELATRGFKVTAICCDYHNGKPRMEILKTVDFINAFQICQTGEKSHSILKKLTNFALTKKSRWTKRNRCYVKALEHVLAEKSDIDVYVSYQAETTYFLKKLIGVSEPVITMFHSDPKFYIDSDKFKIFRHTLDDSEGIQVLLPEYVEVVKQALTKVPVFCIPNVVPSFSSNADYSSKRIISVGRIVNSKRPMLLLEAFAKLSDAYPEWSCEWWGSDADTTLTHKIQDCIRRYNLEERFFIRGVTSNIPEKLLHSSIFAFPTELEGFSLALTEAFAVGLPAVGCKDCFFVSKFVKDAKNGLLVDPTPENFAMALSKLMNSQELRHQLGCQAKEDVSIYSANRIWQMWEELILKLARK